MRGTIGNVAAEISKEIGRKIPPRLISDLFYQQKIDVPTCLIIGNQRFIPVEHLPKIKEAVVAYFTDRDRRKKKTVSR